MFGFGNWILERRCIDLEWCLILCRLMYWFELVFEYIDLNWYLILCRQNLCRQDRCIHCIHWCIHFSLVQILSNSYMRHTISNIIIYVQKLTYIFKRVSLQHACNNRATHLQHTCSTLQHNATHLQHTGTWITAREQVTCVTAIRLQRACNTPATHCNTLQHTCNTLQHTGASVSTRVRVTCTTAIHSPSLTFLRARALFGSPPSSFQTCSNSVKVMHEAYGVATISRLLKITSLFCRIWSLL